MKRASEREQQKWGKKMKFYDACVVIVLPNVVAIRLWQRKTTEIVESQQWHAQSEIIFDLLQHRPNADRMFVVFFGCRHVNNKIMFCAFIHEITTSLAARRTEGYMEKNENKERRRRNEEKTPAIPWLNLYTNAKQNHKFHHILSIDLPKNDRWCVTLRLLRKSRNALIVCA